MRRRTNRHDQFRLVFDIPGSFLELAVLPVTGHCTLRPTAHTLIVALATFLDDTAWQTAFVSGPAR